MATSNRKSAASSARRSSSSSNRTRSNSSSSRSSGSTSRRSSSGFQSNFFKRNFGAIVIFVILFGAIGLYMLYTSRAATSLIELSVSGTNNCIAGGSLEPCSFSYPNRVYYDVVGIGGDNSFQLKSQNNLCIGSTGVQTATLSQGGTRHPVSYGSCSNPNTHWNWRGVGDNHELYNTGTGGCLNALGGTSSGTPLGVYTCNSDQNEKFYKTYKPDGGGSGGSTETTGQKLIDRAHDWAGSPYVFGGGIHGTGYTQSFLNSCEHGTRGGNPVLSYACGTDCSGFISEVVDDVLGWHSVWTVNGGYMSGGNWTQISLSNVKPGDIVTVGDHVEFVQSGSGNNIVSFGDHHTGTNVSAVSTSGYYTRAFRWE